jgi:uncharacterized beta-barrel protein YwiB (DUF1934 family)
MERGGDWASRMEFKLDETLESVYSTPVGDMPLCIYTRRIENTLDERGGSLEFEYTWSFETLAFQAATRSNIAVENTADRIMKIELSPQI